MLYFLRRLTGIAYFLTMLILLQSCVAIYKRSSLNEATSSNYDNWRIKVKTINGENHSFDWIDERNQNIVSIHGTKRILIDKKEVKQIVIADPSPHVIPLDSIDLYYGKVSFLITDSREGYKSQDFIQFEDLGSSFKCYQMNGEDTLTVMIPIDQIEKIRTINMDATAGVSLLVWLAVLTGVGALAAASMEFDINLSN